jgi:DNA helicase IV
MLSEREAKALAEEEALLERVKEVLVAARARRQAPRVHVTSEELRELRDQAVGASEDDAATMMHELAIRQQLKARSGTTPLPDPRAPYLAHLRLKENGQSRDYFLGYATYIDAGANVRVVDWRVAPVAQLFYRYREGDHFEESFPGREASGDVELRRVVVVHQGRLVQLIGDGFALQRQADGTWRGQDRAGFSLASGGAGSATREGALGLGVGHQEKETRIDVTALLDAEQFEAINAPPEEPLLVLGSAGSGKTTVALHRLARIVATKPAEYPLSRARVIVPEVGLARLAARLLSPLTRERSGIETVEAETRNNADHPAFERVAMLEDDTGQDDAPLPETPTVDSEPDEPVAEADLPEPQGPREGARVQTLDAAALDVARRALKKVPRLCLEPPALVTSLKRHPSLYAALKAKLSHRSGSAFDARKLWRELARLYTDRPFLEGVVRAAAGTLPTTAIEETVQHTMLQLQDSTEKLLASISDESRRQAVDGRGIDEGTPDELGGTVDVEDLPILLAMLAWRGQLSLPQASHLVLDEAEDFSLFDLAGFAKLVDRSRSVTLAGDEAQQTFSSFAGWPTSLATLGVKDAATCRLQTSYRCPRPIAELAREVLGPLAPPSPLRSAREGAPVGRFSFPGEAQAWLFLSGALRDLLEAEPHASVAVIAHDANTARRFYALVEELPGSRLVLHGEFAFTPGLDVTDVDSVKGLEFDYVVIPDLTADAWPLSDEGRRRLHVAVTRPSHQLWLVSPGTPSLLVQRN